MNSLSPNNNKIARNFTIKADQRNDFFHSSGYGATQNSGNIGTASSGLSMADRKALEEKRQFVQKYGKKVETPCFLHKNSSGAHTFRGEMVVRAR